MLGGEDMKCANQDKNTKECTCTYSGCSRHGVCCECVAFHGGMGEFPGCLFSVEGERRYDRSLEALISDRKKTK